MNDWRVRELPVRKYFNIKLLLSNRRRPVRIGRSGLVRRSGVSVSHHEIQGWRFGYERDGDAALPPLVFLHGIRRRRARPWRGQLDIFF